MKIVIFGLTVSSSWGNGHATLWRGLLRALVARGHSIVFFEKDVPYYAAHRDLTELPGVKLVLYPDWERIRGEAEAKLNDSDCAMVTSYCPDGRAASDLVLASKAQIRTFYDLDTPVSLDRLQKGEVVDYFPEAGLSAFDLVLSYTGGSALTLLQERLGARRVAPLYGSVDPCAHHPVERQPQYACDLSYLGTYAADRQQALQQLFIEPARKLPHRSFLIGGAQYPQDFPWTDNIRFVYHVPPPEHPAFFSSSRMTLNVTRRAMAAMGWCPSGRLFEAAACGVPLLSDHWEGLDQFFRPGWEILIARTSGDAINALELSDAELASISRAARERTLAEHTAGRRAMDFEQALESVHARA